MNTPRPLRSASKRAEKRAVMLGRYPMGTWPGDGWLREAPRPRDAAGLLSPRLSPERLALQSELKKCMFIPAPGFARGRDAAVFEARAKKADPRARAKAPTAFLHEPLVVGALLALAPPIGVTLLWTSPHYDAEARRAITTVTALMMLLVTAVVMVALAVR